MSFRLLYSGIIPLGLIFYVVTSFSGGKLKAGYVPFCIEWKKYVRRFAPALCILGAALILTLGSWLREHPRQSVFAEGYYELEESGRVTELEYINGNLFAAVRDDEDGTLEKMQVILVNSQEKKDILAKALDKGIAVTMGKASYATLFEFYVFIFFLGYCVCLVLRFIYRRVKRWRVS